MLVNYIFQLIKLKYSKNTSFENSDNQQIKSQLTKSEITNLSILLFKLVRKFILLIKNFLGISRKMKKKT